MQSCSQCGHINSDGVEICLNCAGAMGVACPACGQPVQPGKKFCGECGHRMPQAWPESGTSPRVNRMMESLRGIMSTDLAAKISAASAEILGERREVTVVFVDASNFTSAAHTLDSEDVYVLIDEAMRALVQVVYKYEGTVDKFTGDGLIALFGAPVAHENDPERAIRAALEMQAVLRPLQQRVKVKHHFDFMVRIGVNTGQVIAGEVGSDLHMEYTVIGDTVNLASRLQAAAEPGTVLASFSTYQRTRPLFRYQLLPPISLKGIPEPTQPYQPLGLLERPGRVRGLPGLQVPMIGRERGNALTRLNEAFTELCRGRQSQIALITGEAGLGKSRLVAEFREFISEGLHAGKVRLYEGSCLAYARSRPMWIVAELLRSVVGLSDVDPPDAQLEAIDRYVERLDVPREETLAYLTNLLGLQSVHPGMAARLRRLDASMLQQQTHAALRHVIMAEARAAPTVLILEDLHWVDPASRDFLEYIIQARVDLPLMLVLISRDSERKTVLRSLIAASERHPRPPLDIQLQPLSEAEGQLLVDQLLKQTDEPARALKRRIAERAEGNPFYTEELVRMLIDQGGLTGQEGAWEVTPKASTVLGEVPGTLKGLILARFDRLSEELRRTLQKSAVLGRSFPVGLLTALNGSSAEDVLEQLRELEARQFLIPEPFGAQQGFAFHHTLVQEAVYGTLLKRDRQRIHEQVAQAVERGDFWQPDEKTEVLAYHFAESSHPPRAVPFLMAAAENAARRYANETAIQHYRRAMALVQTASGQPHMELVRIRIGLGQAFKFLGQYEEAGRLLAQAIDDLDSPSPSPEDAAASSVLRAEALRQLADVRQHEGALDESIRFLEAGVDALGPGGAQTHSGLWRSLMDRMAWVRFRQGNLDDAFALASSATLGLGPERADDPTTLANLYNTLGGVFWQQGSISEAIAYVERSLSLYKSLGYSFGMANAYTNLGILYYVRGMWHKAAESFERSDALRRDIGHLPGQSVNLKNLGLLRMAMGEHAHAQRDLEDSLAISRRLGDEFGIVCAEIGLAHLALVQSRYDDAEPHVQRALDLSDAAGEDELVQARWSLAVIQAEKGDLPTALETARQALRMAQAAGVQETEVDCRRVLGILGARAEDWAEAELQLRQSVELCVRLHDGYRQGQALHELGKLYERLALGGRSSPAEWRAKALAAYNQAIELFELLGAAHDLQTAQAALNALHSDTDESASPAARPQPGGKVPGSAEVNAQVPEGEWHRAAVLWLTLLPLPAADEETVFETWATLLPGLVAIAEDHGGQVIRRQDGLTVVFGAPATHEDDPERAVHAALRIHRHIDIMSGKAGHPFEAKLAVGLGNVVAGRVGDPADAKFTVAGESVQAAKFAADQAPSGSVWVSQDTRSATERAFVFGDPITVASPSGAVLVSALTGHRDQPAAARGLPGIKTSLVGRENSLMSMSELARGLSRSRGGLIWIEGEAGIGKSRLMAEFSSSLAANGVLVWTGQCSPQRSRHAFSLITHLLAQVFNLQPTDTPEQSSAKIHRTIQTWPSDALTTRPYLELLSGIRPSGLDGDRLASLEPDQLRQQMFVALRSLIKSMAGEHPMLIVLDDLHWIDPISAELLLFLSNMVASVPVLFLCAQRRQVVDAPEDRLAQVQALHPAQTLKLFLDRLSMEESEALLRQLLSGAEVPVALRSAVLERSEGNPYYIEELVRMLIERGYIQYRQDRWLAGQDVDLKELPLPSSLGSLIQSRVDSLPAGLKQVLQCAAVIGSPFEAGLLEAISSLPDIQSALGKLESRGMLRRAAEAHQWQFNHTLTESAVYNTLLKARRKVLHLRTAQALEARWVGAEDVHADELAYHFTQAEEAGKALIYLIMAGEKAAARYANEEALVYFQQAAESLGAVPDANEVLRWRIAVGLGDVYRFVGEYAESAAALEAALPQLQSAALSPARQAGLHRRLGETAQKQGKIEFARECFSRAMAILGRPIERDAIAEAAQTLTAMAWTGFIQGQFDRAQAACEASLEYARCAGSLSELAMAENILGGIYHHQGEWEPALNHTMKALALREQMGYTWGVAATSSNLGILSVASGDWGKARTFFQQSLTLRQELGDVEGMAIAHNNLGSLARDQGDSDLAQFHFRESLAVATPLKMAYHVANSSLGLAQVFLMKGEHEQARETVASCLAQAERIGAQDLLAEIHRIQAEVLLAQGAVGDANAAAMRSVQLASGTGNRTLESAAWRVVSEIRLQQHNAYAARESITKAWMALADVKDELEAGRVAAQAGRLSLYEGQPTQAKKELGIARDIFSRLGADSDLRRVERISKLPPGVLSKTAPLSAHIAMSPPAPART